MILKKFDFEGSDLMPTCRKCGGSGDMFRIIDSEGKESIVKFEDIKAPHLAPCKVLGEIECSLCGGSGVEEV